MNLPPNPLMRDSRPLDANAIRREKGVAALRDILDVAPTPVRLVTTTRSVQDIAGAVGFTEPFHFSKVFKRVCGESPLHYRRHTGSWLAPSGSRT